MKNIKAIPQNDLTPPPTHTHTHAQGEQRQTMNK